MHLVIIGAAMFLGESDIIRSPIGPLGRRRRLIQLDDLFDCNVDKLRDFANFILLCAFGTLMIHAMGTIDPSIEKGMRDEYLKATGEGGLTVDINDLQWCATWMREQKETNEDKYVPIFAALGTHESCIMTTVVNMLKSSGESMTPKET